MEDIESALVRDARRWQERVDNDAIRSSQLQVVSVGSGASRRSLRHVTLYPILAAAAVFIIIAAVLVVPRIINVSVSRSQSAASSAGPRAGEVDSRQVSTGTSGYADAPRRTLPKLTALQTARLISAPWKLLSLPDAGRTLEIVFVDGLPGCARTAGQYVAETSRSVTIAVLADFYKPDGPCPSMLQVGRVRIHLVHPLGNRQLVHAVVGPQWGKIKL